MNSKIRKEVWLDVDVIKSLKKLAEDKSWSLKLYMEKILIAASKKKKIL